MEEDNGITTYTLPPELRPDIDVEEQMAVVALKRVALPASKRARRR